MKRTAANIPGWRAFAKHVTELADVEGEPSFFDQAFVFLNSFVAVDSCAVFRISGDRKSGAEHLHTFGFLEPGLANSLADDYIRNGFKNDPMVKTARRSSRVRVRQLHQSQYPDIYRGHYFERARLTDKISAVHSSRQALSLVSFYRLKTSGQFAAEDFRDLEELAPIIGRSVLRHIRLAEDRPGSGKGTIGPHIRNLVHDRTQVFSRLSEREKEVCVHLLNGAEEKAIAGMWGLKLSSIVTYRRRLYGKLNIGSKAELFQTALMVASQRL